MDSAEVDKLKTESFDENSGLDNRETEEILIHMNRQDQPVAHKVAEVIPVVARAVDLIVENMKQGGRLIYVGAGTSGRLGVLDAAECPPTFGLGDGVVVGLIAGGDVALRHAVENAEDSYEEGCRDICALDLNQLDSVVGISASGRTPYVLGALNEANRVGSLTISISNNITSKIGLVSSVAIDVDTGPEVLAGSTRLKAGTSQKLVLNMISTAVMVRLGRVYQNLMVDMRVSNDKLRRRALRIVEAACECTENAAQRLLESAHGDVKAAIVMGSLGVDYDDAQRRLHKTKGMVRAALTLGIEVKE